MLKKKLILASLLLISLLPCLTARAQEAAASSDEATAESSKADKSNMEISKRASSWTSSLTLNDPAKEARVQDVLVAHLQAVRDWHNSHPYTAIPAEANPATGKPLNALERQMISDGAIPKSVHKALMSGLRKDLSEEQVETILDNYTVRKVAFTLAGYHAIVPDLTTTEEAKILGFLKQAREQAVDYKSMKQISAIFEIYKTQSEQYLISNGRDWKALYKAYSAAIKAKKAAGEIK